MKRSSLSEIQQHILIIYDEILKLCKKHNIRFCAIGGTAIGTIRHHGFIPWDDDMDLGMPIEDFERFKKICKKELPSFLEYIDMEWMGGKIYDKRTTIIETQFLTRPEKYYGVFIDIFPMIGMPNNKNLEDQFENELKAFSVRAQLFTWYPEVTDFTMADLLKEKHELMHRYNFNDCKHTAGFCYFKYGGAGFRKPLEMPFEDTIMYISSTYDEDLTWHFGNYMQLPPKEKRTAHEHNMFIDLNTPCSVYVKKYKALAPWIQTLIQKKHIEEGLLFKCSRDLDAYVRYLQQHQEKLSLIRRALHKVKNIVK